MSSVSRSMLVAMALMVGTIAGCGFDMRWTSVATESNGKDAMGEDIAAFKKGGGVGTGKVSGGMGDDKVDGGSSRAEPEGGGE